MFSNVFWMAAFVTASLVLSVKANDPSPVFSWVSRAPNRVQELKKEDLSKGDDVFDFGDVSIRIVKRADDLTVHDLAKSSKESRHIRTDTVVRASAENADSEASTIEASSVENDQDNIEAGASSGPPASKTDTSNGQSKEVTVTGEEAQNAEGDSGNSNGASEKDSSSTPPSEGSGESNDIDVANILGIKSNTAGKEGDASSSDNGDTPKSKETVQLDGQENSQEEDQQKEDHPEVQQKEGQNNEKSVNKPGKGFPSMLFPAARDIFSRPDIAKSMKFVDEVVTIGTNKYPKDRVTEVGDLDNNGYGDYVVSSPLANNEKGSIRVYLMAKDNGFLFSRELVPGKWGVNGAMLSDGDLYGSALLKLSDDKSGPCVLVVGAPGDDANGKKKGSIYFLHVNSKGTVSKTVKVSAATDQSLNMQHTNDEGFGTALRFVSDMNGDGEPEVAVQSKQGPTTILFLNKKYEVKSALKVHKDDQEGVMGVMKRHLMKTSSRLDATSLDSLSIRADISKNAELFGNRNDELSTSVKGSGFCVYNETACACGLQAPTPGSGACLDAASIHFATGRTICRRRDCQPSYVCNCDGTQMCKRKEEMKEVYVAEENAGDGEIFCKKEKVNRTINVVQIGEVVPTAKSGDEENFSGFNATNCKCSPKMDVVAPYQCVDYLRTDTDRAVVCKLRDCAVGSHEYVCDAFGDSYCSRANITRSHYVNDGGIEGMFPSIYCHLVTSTVEIVRLVPMEEGI